MRAMFWLSRHDAVAGSGFLGRNEKPLVRFDGDEEQQAAAAATAVQHARLVSIRAFTCAFLAFWNETTDCV
jgi:hypothetical protein